MKFELGGSSECVVRPRAWCLESNWKNWKSFKRWGNSLLWWLLHSCTGLNSFCLLKKYIASRHEFENSIIKGTSSGLYHLNSGLYRLTQLSNICSESLLMRTMKTQSLSAQWITSCEHITVKKPSKEPHVVAVQLGLVSCPRLLLHHFEHFHLLPLLWRPMLFHSAFQMAF